MDFSKELKELGILLNEKTSSQFESYYQMLIEVNQVMNLTAITEKEEVYRKHFLDSLEIVRALNTFPSYTLCDVGSGAGFPSVPLAIVQKEVDVTIIDSLQKRITFLEKLIQKLELPNVVARHARAEDYVKEKREAFDVVTARAVARLNILAELCLPLTKVGGTFLAMKGASGEAELKEASKALEILGGRLENIIHFTLPDEEEQRQILVIKKIKSTPLKYPRNFNKIKERPL
ncbi:MAG: 16S rRNA (guanine(527)-N(7))-methyltransferase RsmG [Anaeroplasmataceae bacterium]|nr:16S rRNA (guanine(527)-N(7))-methyltransferase RsmG [Anaeroplasmataceae bacterium]MDE5867669.1 16S rRNA (guanine(527)-N(7))-methyltransferase RsmG [Anaeroplasmataceae bacterium]